MATSTVTQLLSSVLECASLAKKMDAKQNLDWQMDLLAKANMDLNAFQKGVGGSTQG